MAKKGRPLNSKPGIIDRAFAIIGSQPDHPDIIPYEYRRKHYSPTTAIVLGNIAAGEQLSHEEICMTFPETDRSNFGFSTADIVTSFQNGLRRSDLRII